MQSLRVLSGALTVRRPVLAAVLLALPWAVTSQASEPARFDVLAPVVLTRGSGSPAVVTLPFSASTGSVLVHLRSPAPGSDDAVTSGLVWLNGTLIAGTSAFRESGTSLSLPCTAGTANEIAVELRGKPGATLELRVTQEITTVWEEGFETYSPGAWPSGWSGDGNSGGSFNEVDPTVAHTGDQSLRLFGLIGGCWGTNAYRALATPGPFEIEMHVRNGTEDVYGCHAFRGSVDLRVGTSWWFPSRPLLLFLEDGRILGRSLDLGSHTLGQWVKVNMRYERPTAGDVLVSYWIDDEFRGSELLPAFPHEADLSHLNLASQEGSVWFDDIRILRLP